MAYSYYWLIIVHSVAAVVAVGPLTLTPWITRQIVRGREGSITLLRVLQLTDTFYNRAGWVLILSGTALFYQIGWNQALHAWFLLCITLFLADNVVEHRIREPAKTQLTNLAEYNGVWRDTAIRLQRGAWVQTLTAGSILLLMLLRPSMG